MEFKNLAEVTQLDEVPEGASVLAATAEGEVVRVPGDGLGGGGGGKLVVTFTIDQNVGEITADATYADISQALNVEKTEVVGYLNPDGSAMFSSSVGQGDSGFLFPFFMEMNGTYGFQIVSIDENDSIALNVAVLTSES